MTCVAAVVTDGKIFMAADSFLGTAQNFVPSPGHHGKLFKHSSGMLVGITGVVARRIHGLELPEIVDGVGLTDYVMDTLTNHIWHTIGDKRQDNGGQLLLGIDGRLFRLFSNYVTIEVEEGFAAIGSGGEVATGALAASVDQPPARRVRQAVAIAERYIPTVRGPVRSLSGVGKTKVPAERKFSIMDHSAAKDRERLRTKAAGFPAP